LAELKKLSQEVKTDEELEQVATISSGDGILGKMIAEAIKKVGKQGVITVEEGSGFDTTVEYKDGMEVDRGYVSPHFITNQSTVESVIEDAYILMTDLQISHNYQIVPFLEKIMSDENGGRKNLVIFADLLDEALATIVINCLKGVLNVCVIQPPAYGGRRVDELEDMAALTGGGVITRDSGRDLASITLEELGRADKVVSDRDKTVILGGKGSKEALKRRMKDLEDQITVANTGYDGDIKKQRLAKLAGGVAVINVGGYTEQEIKEKKERVIDAVNATKAAIEEGIVAGGEITLLRLSQGHGILAKA
jgi:chaperonin GroEL